MTHIANNMNCENFSLIDNQGCLNLNLVIKHQQKLSSHDQDILQSVLKIQEDLLTAKKGMPVYRLLQQLDEISHVNGVTKIYLSHNDKKFRKKVNDSVNNKHSTLHVEITFPLNENFSRRRKSRGGKQGHRWY